MEDHADTCFLLSRRSAKFNVLALHQWPVEESAEDDDRCIRTADDWITQVIAPESAGGPIPCVRPPPPLPSKPFFVFMIVTEGLTVFSFTQFINQNSPVMYVASSYGAENWERLRKIKKRVDPENMFQFSLGGSSDINVDGKPLFGSFSSV